MYTVSINNQLMIFKNISPCYCEFSIEKITELCDIYMHIHTYMFTHTQTRTHTQTHTNTHKHTQYRFIIG